MRSVIQRVSSSRVEVEGAVTGSIGQGLLVLLGVGKGDSEADAEYLLDRIAGLRIFPDAEGKMNLNLRDAGGSLLVVSQFTLYGDTSRGRRPGFDQAARPEEARRLYDYFVSRARESALHVETGVFQASMAVHLVNDGPVTFVVESKPKP